MITTEEFITKYIKTYKDKPVNFSGKNIGKYLVFKNCISKFARNAAHSVAFINRLIYLILIFLTIVLSYTRYYL